MKIAISLECKLHKGHITRILKQKKMLKKHTLRTTDADRRPLMPGYRSFNDTNKLFDCIQGTRPIHKTP